MDQNAPISDEKYEGPSKTIIALGKAKAYGWIGSAIGAIGGAFAAGAAVKEEGKMVRKAKTLAEDVGMHIEGKTALRAGGAFLGWMIGHYVGMVYGLNRGLEGAGRGKEQFDKIKSQRDKARSELKEHKEHEKDAVRILTEDTPNTTIATRDVAMDARTAEVERSL